MQNKNIQDGFVLQTLRTGGEVGMRLTDEQVMQDNKRFANYNALTELKYCGWDMPHRKSITNDNIHFYAWLCRSAVALLKEQPEIVRCKDCWKRPYDNCPFYEHMDDMTEDDFFCACGERKK